MTAPAPDEGRVEQVAAAAHRAFHDTWSGPPEPLNLYADSPVWTAIATAVLAAAGPDSTGGQGESVVEWGVRNGDRSVGYHKREQAKEAADFFEAELVQRQCGPWQPVEEADAPFWRCDHYSHDTERCTPTKHYPRTTP